MLKRNFGRPTVLALALGMALVAKLAAAPRETGTDNLQTPGRSSRLVIVVNRQNSVEKVTIADLRKMLLGETTHWPDGRRVTVVMREPGEPEREAILRLICQMDDGVYTRRVLRSVFVGELQSAPKQLATATGVVRFVYNVPGAIGYVRADEINDSVKVVKIDGDVPIAAVAGLTLRDR